MGKVTRGTQETNKRAGRFTTEEGGGSKRKAEDRAPRYPRLPQSEADRSPTGNRPYLPLVAREDRHPTRVGEHKRGETRQLRCLMLERVPLTCIQAPQNPSQCFQPAGGLERFISFRQRYITLGPTEVGYIRPHISILLSTSSARCIQERSPRPGPSPEPPRAPGRRSPSPSLFVSSSPPRAPTVVVVLTLIRLILLYPPPGRPLPGQTRSCC